MDAMEAAKVSAGSPGAKVPKLPDEAPPPAPASKLPRYASQITLRELHDLAYHAGVIIPKTFRRKADVFDYLKSEFAKNLAAAETEAKRPATKPKAAPKPKPKAKAAVVEDTPMDARFVVGRDARLSMCGGQITKLKKGKVIRRGSYFAVDWQRIKNILGDDLRPMGD